MATSLILRRFLPDGNAVRGKLTSPNPSSGRGEPPPEGRFGGVSTLENLDYIIPSGTYTLTVTYSPRFKRPLPLVCGVPRRDGIRFHRGTKPEHSKGCILLPTTQDVDALTQFIRTNEKVLLTITSAPSR